jgi:hypothetical protein
MNTIFLRLYNLQARRQNSGTARQYRAVLRHYRRFAAMHGFDIAR